MIRTLRSSMKHSLRGLKYAWFTERNLRRHIVVFLIVMALGLIFRATLSEMTLLIFVSALVILAELINTAIENVVDLVIVKNFHPLAQVSKDVASGAVLVTAVTSVIVGILIGIKILMRLL